MPHVAATVLRSAESQLKKKKKQGHNRMNRLIPPWVTGSRIETPNLVIVSFSLCKRTLCKYREGAALCVPANLCMTEWGECLDYTAMKMSSLSWQISPAFFPASKVASSALVRKWHHCLWLYSRWREGAAPPWAKPACHMMELKQCANLTCGLVGFLLA